MKRSFLFLCTLNLALVSAAQEKEPFPGDTSNYQSIRIKILKTTDSIQKTPTDADLYFNRSTLYFDIEQWNNAKLDLDTAIAINSHYFGYYYQRGYMKYKLEKWSEAYEDFDKTIKMYPRYEFAYLNRGMVCTELRLWDLADRDFRQALVIKPKWGEALLHL